MPRVVISDTSPVRYLVLIGQVELLSALYRPSWLQIVPPTARPASVSLVDLDRGEHDAIVLALHLKADLVLMDEREGVEERDADDVAAGQHHAARVPGVGRILLDPAPIAICARCTQRYQS
jgi:predicted nucleic acid-binding protein